MFDDDAHPLDILRWAEREFGDDLVVTASFGDATLVHLVSQAIPTADVVLLDTGYLFAETEWFAENLRERLGLRLRIVSPDPDAERDMWQSDPDACCRMRKVEPLERVLKNKRAWITGLRRDDTETRRSSPIVHDDLLRGVTKINPIAAWTDDDVATHRRRFNLPEHPLTDRGYASIGCWPCTHPADDRSGRWAGRDKTECGLHLPAMQTAVQLEAS